MIQRRHLLQMMGIAGAGYFLPSLAMPTLARGK